MSIMTNATHNQIKDDMQPDVLDDALTAGEATPQQTLKIATDRRKKQDQRNIINRRSGMDRRRGPGRRLGELRREAEEGRMSGSLLEFVKAIDEYKRINERPFPSWSEVFEIIHYLGYRKVADQADHINTACDPDTYESNDS